MHNYVVNPSYDDFQYQITQKMDQFYFTIGAPNFLYLQET